MGRGRSVHCGMLGILLLAEPVEFSARHKHKRSILPAWCLQLSKTKQNAKTVLKWLAIPRNAHQNANQKPIGSAPVYWAQCTLPLDPIYQTLLFRFFEGLVLRLKRVGGGGGGGGGHKLMSQ